MAAPFPSLIIPERSALSSRRHKLPVLRRRYKLHIPRPCASARVRPFRCTSFSNRNLCFDWRKGYGTDEFPTNAGSEGCAAASGDAGGRRKQVQFDRGGAFSLPVEGYGRTAPPADTEPAWSRFSGERIKEHVQEMNGIQLEACLLYTS